MIEQNSNEIIRVKRDYERFVTIDENIFENLDPYELKVYMAIRFFADYSELDAELKLSVSKIADKAKISVPQVYRCLNRLENVHFLLKRRSKVGCINDFTISKELYRFKNTPISQIDPSISQIGDPYLTDIHIINSSLITSNTISDFSVEKSLTTDLLKNKSKKDKQEWLSIPEMLNSNPHNISEDALNDWMKIRKSKKAIMTKTAWDHNNSILMDLKELGYNPIDCFGIMVLNNWTGLQVSYIHKANISSIHQAKEAKAKIDQEITAREEKAKREKQKEIEDSKIYPKITAEARARTLKAKEFNMNIIDSVLKRTPK